MALQSEVTNNPQRAIPQRTIPQRGIPVETTKQDSSLDMNTINPLVTTQWNKRLLERIKSEEASISFKIRGLFHFRNLNSEEAALCIQECYSHDSVLLDHEIAYILGQMKQPCSVPFLLKLAGASGRKEESASGRKEESASEVDDNENERDMDNNENDMINSNIESDASKGNQFTGHPPVNPIVRHEAIEALGNFENKSLIKELRRFLNDPERIVKESAELAIAKLSEGGNAKTESECIKDDDKGDSDNDMSDINNMSDINKNRRDGISKFNSRDPAYPFEGEFETARKMLREGNIVEKYKAIFYLRDKNTKESVDALKEGFKDSSALLRHEIAFVYGQMENSEAIEILIKVLENENEEDIVRHEAAESLGNIGGERVLKVLGKYLDSGKRILKESVEVGLGIMEHEGEEYFEVKFEGE